MFVRIFLAFSLIYVVLTKQCYWNSIPYLYYGSKTLYDDVRGDVRDVSAIEGCVPVSIWILSRHGSRNPADDAMATMKGAIKLKDEILKSYDHGKGEMCAQDIENLRKWIWNETIESTCYHLTGRGYQELEAIGRRVNEKFTILLDDISTIGSTYVRASNEQRTKESAKAFVKGLAKSIVIDESLERDEILAPFKICPVHEKEVWSGARMQMEMNRYYQTEEFRQLIQDLQRRTGLPEPISVTNITGVYDLCRFLRMFSENSRSPWCSLFTNEDLTILDYSKDLNHYYRNGYSHPISAKLGYMPLWDLLKFFESSVNTSSKDFKAYFSHDSLLEMMYTALGLFKDYPKITGFERIISRHWRTSLNIPFAANFIAVLHNCTKVVDSNSYQVQFLINEKELHLCDGRTCSWKDFLAKFRTFRNASLDSCQV